MIWTVFSGERCSPWVSCCWILKLVFIQFTLNLIWTIWCVIIHEALTAENLFCYIYFLFFFFWIYFCIYLWYCRYFEFHYAIVCCLSAYLSQRLKWTFLIKICPLSIVGVVVNFSHFHLLQNHWANFKQTWHKASLDVGDSSFFKWRINKFSLT